jgi:hypothetical protein
VFSQCNRCWRTRGGRPKRLGNRPGGAPTVRCGGFRLPSRGSTTLRVSGSCSPPCWAGVIKGVAEGGGQVGPAHPRIFLAHPRIKVKHLLKTRYICNNLKKKSNTKALKWNDKNSRKIRSLFSDYINFLSQA